MTATIRTNRTLFDVYGTLQEVAPILAWIADQAPSAHLKFDADGDEQRVTQWFEFTVWFDDDTDEVNFKMFQSEAFEAAASPPVAPSPVLGTVVIGTPPSFTSLYGQVQGVRWRKGLAGGSDQ